MSSTCGLGGVGVDVEQAAANGNRRRREQRGLGAPNDGVGFEQRSVLRSATVGAEGAAVLRLG
jgi:hypothetical protein